ncbi:MAG: NAD(P) transhydrogenase subunit alpha [Acidimicrobiales bacterium]
MVVLLAVPVETRQGERRVAMVPDIAAKLVGAGWEVRIQSGAGAPAAFTDGAYGEAGASVAGELASLLSGAEVVLSVNAPDPEQARDMPTGVIVVGFVQPAQSKESLAVLADKGATVFSFDFVPRISRAQSMDALSSQATVSGYRAGLLAAEHLAKFFPMFMTAAGTVPPAKVLVMGVGVAGLQAIATARRLGAVVRAYDVRAAAKEEAESLGATFVDLGISAEGAGGYARELSAEELARQQEALAQVVIESDVVITTASVPGRQAPVLVKEDVVAAMAPGSVVIDLAADNGGNCESTRVGEVVDVEGTAVVGVANPPSGMATHASLLYARNAANLLALIGRDGAVSPDFDDEIVIGCCLLREGRAVEATTAEALGVPHEPIATPPPPAEPADTETQGQS